MPGLSCVWQPGLSAPEGTPFPYEYFLSTPKTFP